MTQVSKFRLSPLIEKRIYQVFVDSVKNIRSTKDVISFLNDLLTPTEKIMLSKRIAIALILTKGNYTYDQISYLLKVSRGTVARVSLILNSGGNGLIKILNEIIHKKDLKDSISNIFDSIEIVPSKGTNWSEWKKGKSTRKKERNTPL